MADYTMQRKMMAKHKKIGKFQMCKQNIDRGAMGNMMLKALHLTAALANTDLGDTEKKDIRKKRMGAMLETMARAQFVDDRALMAHRAMPFFNALMQIDTEDEAVLGIGIVSHVDHILKRQRVGDGSAEAASELLGYKRYGCPKAC